MYVQMERNSKNYSKKTTILWPYYGTKSETVFCILLLAMYAFYDPFITVMITK